MEIGSCLAIVTDMDLYIFMDIYLAVGVGEEEKMGLTEKTFPTFFVAYKSIYPRLIALTTTCQCQILLKVAILPGHSAGIRKFELESYLLESESLLNRI